MVMVRQMFFIACFLLGSAVQASDTQRRVSQENQPNISDVLFCYRQANSRQMDIHESLAREDAMMGRAQNSHDSEDQSRDNDNLVTELLNTPN